MIDEPRTELEPDPDDVGGVVVDDPELRPPRR